MLATLRRSVRLRTLLRSVANLAALFAFPSTLLAQPDVRLGGPTTYTTPSPNGEYLFVMIAPRPASSEKSLDPEKEQSQKDIYAQYAATGSGLYRKDGVKLWGVDWYSYRVWPADDGVHLVRLHGDFPLSERFPASKRLSDEVVAEQVQAEGLSFYASGKLLRVYAVRELLKNVESLPHSLHHVLWSADGVLTADGRQFGMMTQEPRQIYFDLDTGRIVIDRPAGLGNAQLWVVRISMAITAVGVVILMAGYLYRRRRGRIL